MRNSELRTGFTRTRIYSQIVGDDAHIVPITATRTVARNPIISNAEFTVQSRAGACSRRKITSFPRRIVGKPPYICFTAKTTDFIPNPPSRLRRATSFAKGG